MATPVDEKLLRQTKFPPEFKQKVDMTKVNIEVIKKFVVPRILNATTSLADCSLLQMDCKPDFQNS